MNTKNDFLKVSIIIAAYNEEKIIKKKIENTLQLDYPKDCLQVIVASDCSIDRTNKIVRQYKNDGIILFVQEDRKGKTMALNKAVAKVNGEIIIFTDATAMLEKDCVKQIVKNFHDTSIGCVCPNVSYINRSDNNITYIEACYRKYESNLKQRESKIGTLAFVPGACFAIRKDLHRPVEAEFDYDCIAPLDVILQNYRVVYEREARFNETVVTSIHDLFHTKVRMIIKDFTGTLSRKELLNPIKYQWISLTLLSHKLIRWMIPFFLIIIFICNLCMIQITFFKLFMVGQIIFYLWALLGIFSKNRNGLLCMPFYFCIVNLAA